MEQLIGSGLRKKYDGTVCCHCLFNLYAEHIMSYKLESRLLGETSTTSDMWDTTLMAESEEKLKSLLMRVKEESEEPA